MDSKGKFWIAFYIVVFSFVTVDNMFPNYQKAKVAQIELEMLKIKHNDCNVKGEHN